MCQDSHALATFFVLTELPNNKLIETLPENMQSCFSNSFPVSDNILQSVVDTRGFYFNCINNLQVEKYYLSFTFPMDQFEERWNPRYDVHEYFITLHGEL